ncbi:MAG: porin family protein [bacterium]
MKNLTKVLLITLLTVLTTSSAAQHGVGVCGGLNLSNFSANDLQEVRYHNRLTYAVGGVLDIQLTKNFVLHLQPVYMQKGSKVKLSGREGLSTLAYFELPVLLRYALGKSAFYMRYHNRRQVYLVAGPTVGFLVSNESSNDIEIIDNAKNFDFGISFGAGISLPLPGNKTLFVEGRYSRGLINIKDDSDIPGTELRTRGIQILAGLCFLIPSFAD